MDFKTKVNWFVVQFLYIFTFADTNLADAVRGDSGRNQKSCLFRLKVIQNFVS